MSASMTALYIAVENNDDASISKILQQILETSSKCELKSTNFILKLLNYEGIVKEMTIKLIAEWAKEEVNRKLLTNKEVISALLQLLQNQENGYLLDVLRALGNICYENADACNIINKAGVHAVIRFLQLESVQEDEILATKACGFLQNLISSHDELQKESLRCGILNIIAVLLTNYTSTSNKNEDFLVSLLTILNYVADYIDDMNISFTEALCNKVVDVFKQSNNPEISVICLDIFHGQSEKDDIKTLLAKNGLCELIFDLIEKYRNEVNDEDSRSVLRMACDLIVIILTGDDCMNELYKNGQGKVFDNMITWLDSSDSDLLSTGILAIGNFARKDVNCIQMVQNGVSRKLIDLILKYNSPESDKKIQHALLSTLKNLVIPQQNKAKVLEEGLIEALYPIIRVEQCLVIFKLLGTFRMVIDGQESAALDLISREDFLERLVYWCYHSDHLGVKGEVPRLLSWMIKHCHSFRPFAKLLSVKDSIKCLVEMIASNHAVMQNEAFYALNLLCIGCSHTFYSQNGNTNNEDALEIADSVAHKLHDEFIYADIGKHLNFVINKYADKMDKQTIDHLLALLEQLIKSKDVLFHLKNEVVSEALEKLIVNVNTQNVTKKINYLMTEISG